MHGQQNIKKTGIHVSFTGLPPHKKKIRIRNIYKSDGDNSQVT